MTKPPTKELNATEFTKRLLSKSSGEMINEIASELAALSRRIADLELKVAAYERLGEFLEHKVALEAVPKRTVRLTNVHITPDMQMDPTIQLWKLEYARNGQPFRWTGPDRKLRFLLPLDRAVNLRLALRYFGPHDPKLQLPLTLLVDGLEVATVSDPSEATGLIVARVPAQPETMSQAFTEITATVQRTVRASDSDPRQLGFGFLGLSVTPDTEETA